MVFWSGGWVLAPPSAVLLTPSGGGVSGRPSSLALEVALLLSFVTWRGLGVSKIPSEWYRMSDFGDFRRNRTYIDIEKHEILLFVQHFDIALVESSSCRRVFRVDPGR